MQVHLTRSPVRFGDVDEEHLRRDLSLVAGLVCGCPRPVYLVGGIGMALRAGGFWREHRDVDLAVFLDDLGAFADHMAGRGYDVVNQWLGVQMTPRLRVHLTTELDWARVQDDPGRLHLRLVPAWAKGFRRPTRTQYIDLFLLARETAGVRLLGYDVTVPEDDFFPSHPVPGHDCLRMPVARYKEYLPPTNAVQLRDMARAGLVPAVGPAASRGLRFGVNLWGP